MGIYIKNIKKPWRCDECMFTDSLDECIFLKTDADIDGLNIDCPIVEIADECKTENCSEKPNNCEHITEDGVTCAKYPACDDCLDNPLNKVKGSERLLKGSEQTDLVEDSPSLVKDLVKAFCEDGTWLERQGVYTLTLAEAKQRAVDIIESVTQTETQNSNLTFEKRTMRDCYNCERYETEDECIECHYEPKDECAKEYEELGLKELKELIKADRKDEPTISKMEQVEDEPQTDCPWK